MSDLFQRMWNFAKAKISKKPGKKALFVDIHGTLLEEESSKKIRGVKKTVPVAKEISKFLQRIREQGVAVIGVTVNNPEAVREQLLESGIDPNLLTELHSTHRIFGEEARKFVRNRRLSEEFLSEKFQATAKAIVIQRVMRRLGIERGNVIMVGDTQHIDLEAARISGIEWTSAKPRSKPYGRREKNDWTKRKGVKRFLIRKPK